MEEWYVGKRGVQCERKVGRERGKGRKRAANQIYDEKAAMGTESGGTCKATMKAHNLNGSSCFVLIAVRMSRRFPWVIAASVSVKSNDAPLCWFATTCDASKSGWVFRKIGDLLFYCEPIAINYCFISTDRMIWRKNEMKFFHLWKLDGVKVRF